MGRLPRWDTFNAGFIQCPHLELVRGDSGSFSRGFLLGTHSFLNNCGIPPSRARIALSTRRTADPRGRAVPHVELSATALTAMYAALAGGAETLMGLTLRLAPANAAGPAESPAALLENFVGMLPVLPATYARI